MKSSYFHYFLLLMLTIYIMTLSTKNFLYGILVISATTFFYNINKMKSIYLALGLLGIWLVSIYFKNFRKDTFQNRKKAIITSNKTSNNTISEGFQNSEKIDISSYKKLTIPITLRNLTELNYVFKILLGYSEEKTRSIILKYDINSIYSLAEKIKNFTHLTYKDQNKKETENDLDKWTKYRKMKAFSELVYLFNFDLDDICATLINREKIYSLEDLYNKQTTLFGIDSLQYLSLQYYRGSKVFTDKHYEILKALEFLEIIEKNITIEKTQANTIKYFKVAQRYSKPEQKTKDIISIILWFEYLEYIPKEDLKTALNKKNEDDYIWVEKTLKNINLQDQIFITDTLFTKYTVSEKVITFLDKLKENLRKEKQRNVIDFSDSLSQEEKRNKFDAAKEIQHKTITDQNYKLIEEVNLAVNEKVKAENKVKLEFTNVDIFKKKFGKVFVDIIDDVLKINQNYYDSDATKDKVGFEKYLAKYLFYFKGVFDILTKEQRMLYVGIYLMVFAVIMNFIEISA